MNNELYMYKKAQQLFQKHWCKDSSKLFNVKRTNISAERAIKVFQDIIPQYKSIIAIKKKFLLSNL